MVRKSSILFPLCLGAIALFGAPGISRAGEHSLGAVTLYDLNDKPHAIPGDWKGANGVLILGFAHDARAQMDQWRTQLSLGDSDCWIEAPVVGDVSALIRPMIKGGMKGKYAGALRAHVTPVFDGADALRQAVPRQHGNVVVLVIGGAGQILDTADGPPDATAIARLRASLQANR